MTNLQKLSRQLCATADHLESFAKYAWMPNGRDMLLAEVQTIRTLLSTMNLLDQVGEKSPEITEKCDE